MTASNRPTVKLDNASFPGSIKNENVANLSCKSIVEKHGGEIWAESKGLGKGTTIFFTLPLANKKSDEAKIAV